ncbi:TIR-like protein FxsC [Plantactinospora sonchi]|uniref:TIR-like protein FxsC n=1 Tax=Plantactinospora sonchi TaxID=1544735 RepID=A0ABU7S3K6_9ACTN
MTEEQFGVAPGAPVFFLSYAHAKHSTPAPPQDANKRVLDLFVDLSNHVVELLGLSAGSTAGFMDRALDGGQRWSDDLAFAAGHCQVFLALISPHYVKSPWCAREWNAFTRRRYRLRPGAQAFPGETPVIPVNWSVVEKRQMPQAIVRKQIFTPTRLRGHIAPEYHHEGIYGLLSLGANGRDTYDAVVWRLAQRIARAFHTHWVEPQVPENMRELPDTFEEDEHELD